MDITTKLSIAYRMYVNKLPVEGVAIACNIDRSTVYRWYKKFKYLGFKRTVKYYLGIRRKKRLRKLDPSIKQKIYELREKHHKCCGQKIKYYLQRDHGIRLSLETVYKVLRQKYTLRNKYKEYKYGEAPKGHKPREVVQTDTVDFGDLFAFTFVDTYTREAFVTLKESLESQSGKESLEEASKRFGWIELLQNDGGPEFKGYFLEVVNNYANKHRISRPYKKNEQSFIEAVQN
jgi:transposase